MKKLLKLLKLTIIFIAIFSTFIVISGESKAFAASNTSTSSSVAQDTQKVQADSKTKQSATIPEKNAYKVTHMQPKGFKYAIFKFFLAMLGVLVSAVAIFAGLKLYKKLALKTNAKFDSIDYDKTLESPKDFKDAINLFLDKTDR